MNRSQAIREAFVLFGLDAPVKQVYDYLKKKKLPPCNSSLVYQIRRDLQGKQDMRMMVSPSPSKEVKFPKRLEVDEIRQLLGDREADRILTAYLHKKALQVKPITLEQIEMSKQLLEGVNNAHTRAAFYHAAMKWILESTSIKGNFVRFLNNLEKEV